MGHGRGRRMRGDNSARRQGVKGRGGRGRGHGGIVGGSGEESIYNG